MRLGDYLEIPQPWPPYLLLYIPTSNVLLRSLRQLSEQRQLRPWYGQASARWRKALFFAGPQEPEVQGEQSSSQIFVDIETKPMYVDKWPSTTHATDELLSLKRVCAQILMNLK